MAAKPFWAPNCDYGHGGEWSNSLRAPLSRSFCQMGRWTYTHCYKCAHGSNPECVFSQGTLSSLSLWLLKVTFLGLPHGPPEVLTDEGCIFNKHSLCSFSLSGFMLRPSLWSRDHIWIVVLPLTSSTRVWMSRRNWQSLLLHPRGAAEKMGWDLSQEGFGPRPDQGSVLQVCSPWVSVTTQVWRRYHLKNFYDSVSDSRAHFPGPPLPAPCCVLFSGTKSGSHWRRSFLGHLSTSLVLPAWPFLVWGLPQLSLPPALWGSFGDDAGIFYMYDGIGDPCAIFQVNHSHTSLWHLMAYEVGQRAWCSANVS